MKRSNNGWRGRARVDFKPGDLVRICVWLPEDLPRKKTLGLGTVDAPNEEVPGSYFVKFDRAKGPARSIWGQRLARVGLGK